ncbi:hypothetical protein [Nonomuraea sp. SYSU D8015]|uniref:hypothetical protein n=1 Tax=Nonomuraea sp. SYSU D8015 TaxID=2593644 RepID=UPI00166135DA|nr:hypothetical protein [Nonomuraea sp. SYSU D8015]
MRRSVLLLCAVPLLSACGASALEAGSTPVAQPESVKSSEPAEASQTPAPTPSKPARSAKERKYLKVLRAALGKKLKEDSYLKRGYDLCGRGDEWPWPPTLGSIIASRGEKRDVYEAAIRYLCPKYLPVWRKAQGGFGDGLHKVGKDIGPGSYRMAVRPDYKTCWWDRKTSGGDTIDTWLLHNDPPRVMTVTLNRGERFDTRGCGVWIRVP